MPQSNRIPRFYTRYEPNAARMGKLDLLGYIVIAILVGLILIIIGYLIRYKQDNAALSRANETIRALYEANGLPAQTPAPLAAGATF